MTHADKGVGNNLANRGIPAATIPVPDQAVGLVEVSAALKGRVHPEIITEEIGTSLAQSQEQKDAANEDEAKVHSRCIIKLISSARSPIGRAQAREIVETLLNHVIRNTRLIGNSADTDDCPFRECLPAGGMDSGKSSLRPRRLRAKLRAPWAGTICNR